MYITSSFYFIFLFLLFLILFKCYFYSLVYLYMYVCTNVCMHVFTVYTQSSWKSQQIPCVCAHLANKAHYDSDSVKTERQKKQRRSQHQHIWGQSKTRVHSADRYKDSTRLSRSVQEVTVNINSDRAVWKSQAVSWEEGVRDYRSRDSCEERKVT